ncbi:MAG: tripartite tricarboxylate transporter TctB family protein [Desulfocucumaceae bacterium]
MNYRVGSIVLTSAFTLTGVMIIYQALQFPSNEDLGPAFFPSAIAVLMLAFCAIVLLRSFRVKSEKVEFNNKLIEAHSLIITVLFLILWGAFHDLFLLWVFLLSCGMFWGFQGWKVRNIKVLLTGLGIGSGVTLFVYLVFGVLINLNF